MLLGNRNKASLSNSGKLTRGFFFCVQLPHSSEHIHLAVYLLESKASPHPQHRGGKVAAAALVLM